MAIHENGKVEPDELGSGPAIVDWSRESDKEALMPESSLQIEDGLLAALNVSHRKAGVSRFLFVFLSCLVAVLAVVCCLLSAALVHVVYQQQATTGTVTLLSSDVNLTAANAALEKAVFPIPVDLSREACSNNGIQYAMEACTCFACFTGSQCQDAIPLDECTIDANGGTPLLFEEYWTLHPEAETRIRASDHIGYMSKGQLPRLEAAVRALHAMVGNAITEGKHVVFGPGSSEVLTAALFASTMNLTNGPALVYAQKPYYSAYPSQTNATQSRYFSWTEVMPDASQQPVLEWITAPNNPDGTFRNKTVAGAMGVFDHAYYWPQYSGIHGPVDYNGSDIAVFTLSKLTGHAGSRIGWAIVSDDALAAKMVALAQGPMSYESQARATVLIEQILGTQGDVLGWASKRMQSRWDRLQTIFNSTSRFSLGQALEAPAYDTWTGRTRQPSPAYLWLRCNDAQRDPDCAETMLAAGLLNRAASGFGAGPENVRLELLMRQEEFELMADKLQKLALD